MSLDDYYVDRDKITPGPDGKVDLEHINTIDTELFGLPDEAVWVVRAACAVLKDVSLIELWNAAARRSQFLAENALESASKNLPINVKGGF